MGRVRHPKGVRPHTLFDLRTPSVRGDRKLHLDSKETIVFGTVLQRKVSFDNDAMMQFHFRECHPLFINSKEYWGTYRPPVPITHFPHPDVVKVAVRKAIDDAHWLYVEVYGEKDNKNTTCTIEPQLPTNQQAVRDQSSPEGWVRLLWDGNLFNGFVQFRYQIRPRF